MALDNTMNRREFDGLVLKVLASLALGAGAASIGCGFFEKRELSEEDIREIKSLGYAISDLQEKDGSVDRDYVVIKKGDAVALVRTGGKNSLDTVLLKMQHAYEGNSLRGMTENYLRENEDKNPVITNNLADALMNANITLLHYELSDQRSLVPGTNYIVGYLVFEGKGIGNINALDDHLQKNPGFTSYRADNP